LRQRVRGRAKRLYAPPYAPLPAVVNPELASAASV